MLTRSSSALFSRQAARAAAAIWLLLAAPLLAFDWKTLKPQGYVSDFAGVVDPASRAELERYAALVERATGAEMAFVVLRSLEDEPVEDVANTLFRAWGIGKKGQNEGILLLLAVAERRSRLEVGYGLEPILPDGLAGSILREMRPALRQQHYGEALLAAAHGIGTRIAQAKGVSLTDAPRRRLRERPQDTIPWPLLLGVAGMLLFSMTGISHGARRRRYGGFVPPVILPGGWHMSRGGGGFGGYDSPGGFGGFGGFGGGDSGGGGASSNW